MGHSLICFKTKKGEKNQHWDHADAFEASSLMFVTKQTNEQTDKAKQTKKKQQQQQNKQKTQLNKTQFMQQLHAASVKWISLSI